MKPRWRVEEHVHSAGGLFELEETRSFRVFENGTDRLVLQVEGSYAATFGAGTWVDGCAGGVTEVVIEGDDAVVTHASGQVERVALR